MPTLSCFEMSFDVVWFLPPISFVNKIHFAIISTCPINVGPPLSAHLWRSTRRSLAGDALRVGHLQVACLWHASPTGSHGFCLPSIFQNLQPHIEFPTFESFGTYRPAQSPPALNSDTIQVLWMDPLHHTHQASDVTQSLLVFSHHQRHRERPGPTPCPIAQTKTNPSIASERIDFCTPAIPVNIRQHHSTGQNTSPHRPDTQWLVTHAKKKGQDPKHNPSRFPQIGRCTVPH